MLRLLLALTVFLIPIGAHACGWFFPSVTSSSPTMEAQRVLMIWKKNTVDIHVSVRANSVNDDFAWVLPVAADPKLDLGNLTLLDALDGFSRPTIEIIDGTAPQSSTNSGFCEGDAVLAGANFGTGAARTAPVQVESGTLGNYEYDIVKAETVEEMIGWLTEDGYTVPEGASDRLAPYVAASMSFVWVKLAATADMDTMKDLQPLVVTVPRPVTGSLSFPLALSAGSSSEIMSTHFYVLADKRYRVENYPSTDLQGVADRLWEMRSNFESYESIVDLLTEESGGRLMITELAGDIRENPALPSLLDDLITDEAYYLTRLTSRTRAEALQDATVTYAHQAPDVSNVAFAQAPQGEDDAGFPLVVLCTLLGLLGWRKRKESSPAH